MFARLSGQGFRSVFAVIGALEGIEKALEELEGAIAGGGGTAGKASLDFYIFVQVLVAKESSMSIDAVNVSPPTRHWAVPSDGAVVGIEELTPAGRRRPIVRARTLML